ncbi:unnamed protein product [Leptidea sinapis]|uniref:Uncharacterized protein n=1 Tax=Leptidea sinapis TaxID=189913 RepID=A0A5E4Q7M3_9NEOP|nr:unnamed protein product [Leptidea sinapis]
MCKERDGWSISYARDDELLG